MKKSHSFIKYSNTVYNENKQSITTQSTENEPSNSFLTYFRSILEGKIINESIPIYSLGGTPISDNSADNGIIAWRKYIENLLNDSLDTNIDTFDDELAQDSYEDWKILNQAQDELLRAEIFSNPLTEDEIISFILDKGLN